MSDLYCEGSRASVEQTLPSGHRAHCPVCDRVCGLAPKRGTIWAHYKTERLAMGKKSGGKKKC